MEIKEFENKICLLRADYIQLINKQVGSPIKTERPYLIIKLEHKGKSQYFGIPLQTSIKNNFGKAFWHKLPLKLDTEVGCSYGLVFSQIIPLAKNAIRGFKGVETQIPRNENKRTALYFNLTNLRLSDIPEKAQTAFSYIKKNADSILFDSDVKINKAYVMVANALFEQTIKHKDKMIDEIKKEALNYLNNHYNAPISSSNKTRYFADIPKHHTKIDELIPLAEQYEQTAAPAPQKRRAFVQKQTEAEDDSVKQYFELKLGINIAKIWDTLSKKEKEALQKKHQAKFPKLYKATDEAIKAFEKEKSNLQQNKSDDPPQKP